MTLHLTDPTRTITLADGQVVPRPVTTVVRYPTLPTAHGTSGGTRQPASADGPFPLIVFGHGFDIMPGAYSRLLNYWTSAGFVVATPIFPLENPHAPGGPNENDLPNQPQDMRFVISRLLQDDAQPKGPLSGLIDKHEVAVAGHSDGGDTALAIAYDPSLRDPHLQAAVILSGAEIPMLPAFQIGAGGPPLLAIQGTADTINLPSATAAYFNPAPPPKYLLRLVGGSHIGPYSTDGTQLAVVKRVTTAFLQRYLDHDRTGIRRMLRAGDVAGVATMQSHR
jgi:dienelactone hydrolase